MKKPIFWWFLCLVFLPAEIEAQSINAGALTSGNQDRDDIELSITVSTNTLAVGEHFTIFEDFKNSSTNSIVLNSGTKYLINDAGRKYELPTIIDIFSEFGPNIKGPSILAGNGFVGSSYTVQVNTNIEPGDFKLEATENITTSSNKVVELKSNAVKLRIIRKQ